jgi:hypothetical protein
MFYLYVTINKMCTENERRSYQKENPNFIHFDKLLTCFFNVAKVRYVFTVEVA